MDNLIFDVYKSLKSTNFSVVLLTLSFSSDCFSLEVLNDNESKGRVDIQLLNALNDKNEKAFVMTLELGGNPTKRIDDTQFGWVFCGATAVGNEKYLTHIIDSEYDVNFRQVEISPEISLPLACAVRSDNLEAIKILVKAGADPAETICIRCNERLPSSLLSEAVLVGKHHLANWLINNGNYSDLQFQTVVDLIERFPLPENSKKKNAELDLVRSLRKKGLLVRYADNK